MNRLFGGHSWHYRSRRMAQVWLRFAVIAALSARGLCFDLPYYARDSCGVTSLFVVCKLLDVEASLARIHEVCPIHAEGSNVENLVSAAAELGLQATPLNANLAYLQSIGGPAIIDLPRGHFCVFLGWRAGNAVCYDYPHGVVERSREEFAKQWNGHVILFQRLPASSSPRAVP